MALDAGLANNVATADVQWDAPDLVPSVFRGAAVFFGQVLDEINYTVSNQGGADIAAGTTWTEQVWLGTGANVFDGTDPDAGRFFHLVSAEQYSTPLASGVSVMRTLTPDLTDVELPAQIDGGNLSWVVLIDFPSDTDADLADTGDILEAHELAGPAQLSGAERALNSNNVLTMDTGTLNFHPLQFETIGGALVQNESTGVFEFDGPINIGLGQPTGSPFQALRGVNSSIVAGFQETTIEGTIAALAGSLAPLFHGSFTLPTGGTATLDLTDSGEVDGDFKLAGNPIGFTKMRFIEPDGADLPFGQVQLEGAVTLPELLGGIELAFAGDSFLTVDHLQIGFTGVSATDLDASFNLGGLAFDVQQLDLQMADTIVPELRVGGRFFLPQFGATVQLVIDEGNYFSIIANAGPPHVGFAGSIDIDHLPIGGDFSLIETRIDLTPADGDFDVNGEALLDAPGDAQLATTFTIDPEGQLVFDVATGEGEDFKLFGLGIDVSELALTTGTDGVYDPRLEIAGSVLLPMQLTGTDTADELSFQIDAAEPLIVDSTGVHLAVESLSNPGTFVLDLFGITPVALIDPTLVFNTEARWAELRATLQFGELGGLEYDFNATAGGAENYIRIRDNELAPVDVVAPIQFDQPLNITASGSYNIDDIELTVDVAQQQYVGTADLNTPAARLLTGMRIAADGTTLTVATANTADMLLVGMPFDLTGAVYTSDRDPSDDVDFDPQLALQGSLMLPASFADVTLEVTGDDALLINGDGLVAGAAGLTLPPETVLTIMDLLQVRAVDAALVLDLDADTAELQGQFVIPSLNDLPIDVTAPNFIRLRALGEQLQFAADVRVVDGQFPIAEGFVLDGIGIVLQKQFEEDMGTIEGALTFRTPIGHGQLLDLVFDDGRVFPAEVVADPGLEFTLFGTTVTLDRVAFNPDRTHEDNDPFDPEFTFNGSLTLPPELGGIVLAIEAPNVLTLSEAGLDLTGFALEFPDASFTLKGVTFQAEDMRVEYQRTPAMLKIQGRASLPDIYEITADFAGDNFIKITETPSGEARVDVVGEISLAGVTFPGDVFKLENARAYINTEIDAFEGQAKVVLPTGLSIDGTLGFLAGALNKVDLDVDGLSLPIGTTGAVLKRIRGGLDHLAPADPDPTDFSGGLGIAAGPTFSIPLPDWAGGGFEGSLIRLDVDGTISAERLIAEGQIEIVGGAITGSGETELNWTEGFLDASGTFNMLGGIVVIDSSFRATSELNINMAGMASVSLPDFLPLVGGAQVASGNALFTFSNDGNYSNDFVAGWSTFETYLGDVVGGVKVFFDGSWESILSEASIPSAGGSGGSGAALQGLVGIAATGAVGESFNVAASSTSLLLQATWENESADVQIQLEAPDGTIYTEADFLIDPDVQIVDSFTSNTSRTVGVANPAAGTWTITVVETTDLGDVQFNAFVNSTAPVISLDQPAADTTADPNVTLGYEAADADSDARISFFYDTDDQDHDGILIADGIAEADGPGTFDWDTTGVPAGQYRVYAVIQDDNNAPVFSDYAAGAVTVLAPLGNVAGIVFDDLNGNGTQDDGEPGIVGRTVIVDLDDSGDQSAGDLTTSSGDDGSYGFVLDQGATYSIIQELPAGDVQSSPAGGGGHSVALNVGESHGDLNFGAFTPRAIRGTVFDDLNGNDAFDIGEPGIPDAIIFLDSDGDGGLDASETSTSSDALGNYSLAGLAKGEYRIAHEGPTGFLPITPIDPNSHLVVVETSDQTIPAVDFADRPPGLPDGGLDGAGDVLAQAAAVVSSGTTTPPPGFTTSGNVTFDNGAATLHEAGALFSGLEHTFVIPAGAAELRFTIVDRQLTATAGAIPDAFEVALLDHNSGAPLLATARGLTNTDALLNVQADGSVFFGPDVTVPGAGASGSAVKLAFPLTVVVDVSSLPAGTLASLQFDLLGFGVIDSNVVIDDIRIAADGPSPPTARDDNASTPEDTAVDVNELADDTDPDGDLDPTSVAIVTPPTHGTANVLADGTIRYTPAADFAGADSFTYTVDDDLSNTSNVAQVDITVDPVADAPTLTVDPAQGEVDTPIDLDITAALVDNDGSESLSILIAGIPAGATLSAGFDNSDGSYTLTAGELGGLTITSAPGSEADFSLTVTATATEQANNDAAANTATLDVTVLPPPNVAPDATDDTDDTDQDMAIDIDVLANDNDDDNDHADLFVSDVTQPANGTAAINADNTVKYTPDAGFFGDDTFTYDVSDGNGGTSKATVTVTVHQVIASDPLLVTAMLVNDGVAQRSNIEKVTVTFSRSVNFDDLVAGGQLTDAVRVVNLTTGEQIPLAGADYQYDAATSSLTIDLTGDGFGGSQLTVLKDGRHEVQLDTTLIAAADDGTALSDEDGTSDAVHRLAFHRLLADFNGDARISRADLKLFRAHYRSRAGEDRYDFVYDLDGNGRINRRDFLILRRRAGRSV